jgi:hypothetical protein
MKRLPEMLTRKVERSGTYSANLRNPQASYDMPEGTCDQVPRTLRTRAEALEREYLSPYYLSAKENWLFPFFRQPFIQETIHRFLVQNQRQASEGRSIQHSSLWARTE